jgi:dsRNA-specific ribonuclease
LNIETSGIGSSRKKAEQDAAAKALKDLKLNNR